MKILMISHEYPPIGGGGANACMYLSREYAKKHITMLQLYRHGLRDSLRQKTITGFILSA